LEPLACDWSIIRQNECLWKGFEEVAKLADCSL
jgi:hypothetical protein